MPSTPNASPNASPDGLTPRGATRSGAPRSRTAASVSVDVMARVVASERRIVRMALADELAAFEAHKRRVLAQLNDWVFRWCRDHEVRLDDLDQHGAPRTDRCTAEALTDWATSLHKMTISFDTAMSVHLTTVAELRGKLEQRRDVALTAEVVLPWVTDGVAITMATRHAATMFPRLEPVYPR